MPFCFSFCHGSDLFGQRSVCLLHLKVAAAAAAGQAMLQSLQLVPFTAGVGDAAAAEDRTGWHGCR
jgi:hypothetical protein